MTPDTERALADAALERHLDDVENAGFEATQMDREWLAAASEHDREVFFAAVNRALLTSRVPRQVVRYSAPRRSDAERRFHEASDTFVPRRRDWRITAFNEVWCGHCDTTFERRYPSPAEATDAAIAHLRACGGGHE